MSILITQVNDPSFDASAVAHIWERVKSANAFTSSDRLRQYQKTIIETGVFLWPDITSGRQVPCDGTLMLSGKTFAWRFCGESTTFWITSDGPSHAFEINGILIEGQEFLRFEVFAQTVSAGQQLDEITKYLSQSLSEGNVKGSAPILICGHQNFAHFIWNELPALIEVEALPSWEVEVVATWETIAPLEKLITVPGGGVVTHIQDRTLYGVPGRYHSTVIFSVGSQRVSIDTKQRVINACAVEHIKHNDTFTLWVSLRLTHRFPVNQGEFVRVLVEKLGKLGFPVELILDGYSLAADIEVPGRHYRDLEEGRSSQVASFAHGIIQQLEPVRPENVSIFDVTTCNLPKSIGYARYADYYFCHHGTQQHKIGWIYATPGIIHAPPNVLRTQPTGWTHYQSEGSICPIYVPLEFVADIIDDHSNTHHASVNYEFVDPATVAEFLIEHIIHEYSKRR